MKWSVQYTVPVRHRLYVVASRGQLDRRAEMPEKRPSVARNSKEMLLLGDGRVLKRFLRPKKRPKTEEVRSNVECY